MIKKTNECVKLLLNIGIRARPTDNGANQKKEEIGEEEREWSEMQMMWGPK